MEIKQSFAAGHEAACLAPYVKRSWKRSQALGLNFTDKLIFNAVPRNTKERLESQYQSVLTHVTPELHGLMTVLCRGGWAVSFIDANGVVVRTVRNDFPEFDALALAFRPGINLGESGVGTTGPSCAIAERSVVVVSGEEHYLAECASYTCSSAPIFNHSGALLGVVNASCQFGQAGKVPFAVTQTASRIEDRLIRAIPNARHLEISIPLSQGGKGLLAIAPDGEFLGANQVARQMLGLEALTDYQFDSVFVGRLGWLFDQSRLHSGVLVETNSGQLVELNVLKCQENLGRGKAKADSPSVKCPSLPYDRQHKADNVLRAFRRDIPVLVTGKTGTGKEVFARWLHEAGPRKNGPFVAINCSAIPDALIESELFGYQPGAFTGASRKGMPGKILAANGGSLFLDEIGDMPLSAQVKLLRVIQERAINPIGGGKDIQVDFSLICATHRDLSVLIRQGGFREDLYYRINGINLCLPELHERRDFTELVGHVLKSCVAERELVITPSAFKALKAYRWPGNIRQLQSVIRVASVLATDGVIDIEHLSPEVVTDTGAPSVDEVGLSVSQYEAVLIKNALVRHHGNISATARSLSINRATLYNKLKGYGITWADARGAGRGTGVLSSKGRDVDG